jgi:pyruvate,water dikinase
MTKSDQAENYLVSLRKRHCPAAIGNKARGLFELKRKGYLIPDTFVCQWQAYQDYISSGEEALVRLRTELTAVVREGRAYAVRSSANLEDDLEQSFAGQFSTHLNVIGLYQVLSSVRAIWEDTQKESIHTYLHRRLGRDQELLMAVIIQEMIQPALSGVVFSKNPITTMDEIIVEAVRGYGTDLVQSGFTPLRWVNKWGNWIEKPECSPMDQAVIEEIVKQTRCIVKHFHKELDLEWVWDGQRLYWLQMRDITSLQNVTFYSNRIAKEMTPGQIKPLVWTVSIPNPTLAWVKLISEAIGENPLDPAKMLKLFHYRAYFNMAEFGKVFASLGLPRESLEMMMGVLPPGAGRPPMKPSMKAVVKLPRLAKFAWDKWSFSRVLETRYPLLFEEIHKFPIQFKPGSVEQSWLIQQIDRIHPLNREIAYLTVVTILMMMVYISLLRRQLAKRKVDFQEVDLTAGEEEFKLFDPSFQLADLHRQYLLLPPEIQYYFQAGDFSSFLKTDDYLGMKDHVNQFLERFGHMSDTTAHFCNPAWREQPGMILKLIANYEKPAEQSPQRMDLQELPGSSFILKYLFRRAREYRLWRERISSLFSYSVMLFRAYYLAIAENWVINGWIENRKISFIYMMMKSGPCFQRERYPLMRS